jgi:hypothetical protein
MEDISINQIYVPPSVISHKLGAPVNTPLAVVLAAVLLAAPKVIEIFGLTGLLAHPIYIASRFVVLNVIGVLLFIKLEKVVTFETFQDPIF